MVVLVSTVPTIPEAIIFVSVLKAIMALIVSNQAGNVPKTHVRLNAPTKKPAICIVTLGLNAPKLTIVGQFLPIVSAINLVILVNAFLMVMIVDSEALRSITSIWMKRMGNGSHIFSPRPKIVQ